MKRFDIYQAMQLLSKYYESFPKPMAERLSSKFEILVATILSARTRDETTLKVIDGLFKEIKDMDDLKKVSKSRLEKLIYPVGFYRNKAAHLKELPLSLDIHFGGVIPEEVEDLVKLPGVGRKTANLVSAVAFGKPAICVDVHVHRISNRWGYIRTRTPDETEQMLRKKLPLEFWNCYNSYLVVLGQNICLPRKPKCGTCRISGLCNKAGVV